MSDKVFHRDLEVHEKRRVIKGKIEIADNALIASLDHAKEVMFDIGQVASAYQSAVEWATIGMALRAMKADLGS